MLHNIFTIFINLFYSIKFLGLSALSFITGSTLAEGTFLLFFQEATPPKEGFWDSWFPAFLGGVGGLIVVIIGQISSHYLEQRTERNKQAAKEKEQKEAQQGTFSEKIAELQHDEREKFLEDLKKFHIDKLRFKNSQIKDARIAEFAAKQREHLAVNEVNRLWAHIHMCHAKMKLNGLEIPEMTFKNQDEIMAGLDERIAKYADSLDKEYDSDV